MTRLPNFVVVGAPKCGTTSIYHYLAQHPDVFLPERKELHYFSRDQMRTNSAGPGDAHVLKSICAEREEYEAYYRTAAEERAVGDISPSYLYYHGAAEEMRDVLGEAAIVVIVRNPIEKAFSHYMHLVRDNREPLAFKDALAAEEERTRDGWAALWRYAGGSCYVEGIEHYRRVFGAARVRVLVYEDLRADRDGFLRGLMEFLEVDPDVELDAGRVYHRSGKPRSKLVANLISKPGPLSSLARVLLPPRLRNAVRAKLQNLNTGAKGEIDDDSRALLRERFRDDTRALQDLLGRRLPWSDEVGA